MQKSSSKPQPAASGSSFGVDDVMFVLFKHKWKIVFLSLLGFGVAAVMFVKQKPLYKSESKLLIRYVMAKGTVDPFETVSAPGGGARGKGDPVINTEIEILYSVDLWKTVADVIGTERLAPHAVGDAALPAAVAKLRPGLEVLPGFSSSVLHVNYSNENPKLSQEVLDHLLDRYFKKHLEIHRSAAEFDLVAKQAAEAKQRLLEKEIELDLLRKESGIMSLTDATAALIAQRTKTEEELLQVRAELAAKQAVLDELEQSTEKNAGSSAAASKGVASPSGPPPRAVTEYRSVMEILAFLQKRDLELRIKFKPGNRLIELNRQQINSSDARRRALEQEYPGLVAKVESGGTSGTQTPQEKWIMEKAALAATEAKETVLNAHLKEIREQFSNEYTVGAKVEELQRERDMLDTEYRTLETKLKDARINRTLDPSRMPNITIFQHPTEPVKTFDEKMQKIIYGIAGSGVGLGLGLAFLIELLFNRKISRSIEIQTRLQLPLLLSIPYLGGKNRGRFMLPGAADLPLLGAGEDMELGTLTRDSMKMPLANTRSEHFILPYAETLRDRIVFNFEINNVVHKPKFVAVTGLSEGAGASTIAAGLAKSFSEINGAKVLLVDLSSLHPEQNPIYGEVPLHSLTGALELTDKHNFRENPENLYYASALARRDETGLSSFTPIHLYELMPHLQASAYDYIIFDMPMIDETSRTLAMAGMMDKVLLVLDAENTSRDALKWGYSELVKGKADVSCIFNKTRSVAPSWLIGDN